MNSDSGSTSDEVKFEGMEGFTIDKSSFLFNHMSETRVFKSDEEIQAIRYSVLVSSNAHKEVSLIVPQPTETTTHFVDIAYVPMLVTLSTYVCGWCLLQKWFD